MKANQTLNYAAAPDLLAALCTLRDAINDGDPQTIADALHRDALPAIAKAASGGQSSKSVLTIDVDAFVAAFVGFYDFSSEQIQDFLDDDFDAVDWRYVMNEVLSDMDIEDALAAAVKDGFRKKLGQPAASGS